MKLRWIAASLGAAFVVVITLAAFLLQENLTLYFLNPKTPYETYTPPPAPDYADAESWAELPESADADPSRAAVFYIHSTTYASGDQWNGPVTDNAARTLTLKTALPNEAGPFLSAGDVYAPYYRQATLFAFFTQKHQGREARKTAYDDVNRAFANFLERIGPDRPIFIVGYGQGALHAQRLLIDWFQDNEVLRQRLVAAYIVDQATPVDLFNYALANIPACDGPSDFRCVISWSAYSPAFEREMWRTRTRQLAWEADGDLASVEGRSLLCTNPVTWQTGNETAAEEVHLGAASASGMPFGEPPALVEQSLSVRCENGIAVISKPGKGWLQRPRWFGRQWAPLDFNLFYEDIRVNALERLAALEEVRAVEATLAPPMAAPEAIEESPINRVPDM